MNWSGSCQGAKAPLTPRGAPADLKFRLDAKALALGSNFTFEVDGEGVRESMSKKIKYTDEPLGNLRVVPDFLPRPKELVFRDEGVKVTIALSKRSVDFFKGEARKRNTQYQRMIRRLLDAYAEHHSRPPAVRSTRTRPKTARAG